MTTEIDVCEFNSREAAKFSYDGLTMARTRAHALLLVLINESRTADELKAQQVLRIAMEKAIEVFGPARLAMAVAEIQTPVAA